MRARLGWRLLGPLSILAATACATDPSLRSDDVVAPAGEAMAQEVDPEASPQRPEVAPVVPEAPASPAARRPRPVDRGRVAAVIPAPSTPPRSLPPDLAQRGYVVEEFVLEGKANAYAANGALGLDGKWGAQPNGQADYRTRLLVRRPVDAAKFNGTVLVEWLNVTGGIDAEVGYVFAWEELLRSGFAYVGVSVQQVGVNALKSDAARYGTLSHPGDAYAYDIYAQAGAAIGWPGELDALRGLKAERLIAYGQSQSAMRMITYANAVQPLTRSFDGIIIHSRAGWGAAVGTESDALLGNGKPVRVREDINAKVLQLFTESELFLLLGPSFAARQPDTDSVRSWEMAGTAHMDSHLLGGGNIQGLCGLLNNGQQHVLVKAGLRGMHRWLKDGVPLPKGPPMQVTSNQSALARDPNGNALGGIRTPAVDVPIATLTGSAPLNPLCMLSGSTKPFTAQRLRTLYPTHQTYVDKVTAAARAGREAGFILPEEEAMLVAEANAAKVP
jgi:hypothetical protein